MLSFNRSGWRFSTYAVCLMALFVAACSSGKLPKKTIVENRSPMKSGMSQNSLNNRAEKLSVADEQPGTYVVKAGDTLAKIGLETGNNWRDIARWNRLEDPNRIEIGQILRLTPDSAGPSDIKPAPVRNTRTGPETQPIEATPAKPSAASPLVVGDDDLLWAWPSAAPVTQGFDGVRNKGLAFAGKLGDPVYAAGDGKVVYSGSGLRGYGKLIIIRHNPQYLSAYAHNDTILVSEEQSIKRGQKIATVGNTDADEYKLHFEIRRLGKPVDPKSVLPPK
jgi:lipoprotein NlpD